MKKNFVTILSFICCLGAFAEKSVPRVEVTMPFHKGVNLSNWLEPWYGLSVSSNFFGRQDFEDMKSIGIEIVRVPIHFEAFSSKDPDFIIDEKLWKIIDETVAWCTELKLYMIIDMHNDCNGNTKTRPDVEKMLNKIWPQIAERYKNSSEYVLYEVHNEPHFKSGNLNADIDKWGKIQGRILKLIRTIDTKHTVIVGAENWNNIEALLKLPDYKDDNIIYNFHDYSPFFFTHQGAAWTDLKNIKNIPFPYNKDKMPPFPNNESPSVKQSYKNYEHDSSEEVLCKPLNDAVNFANKRKVALMCNEFGVDMTHPDNQERINWYRLKNKWMDERNIIRISWDYKASFGIFNTGSLSQQFPQDVNVDLIEAMSYKMPKNIPPRTAGWLNNSFENGEYKIFRNTLAKNILPISYLNGGKSTAAFDAVSENNELCISIPEAKPYEAVKLDFLGAEDFTSLVNSGLSLEFEVKTAQKDFKLDVYFMDKEDSSKGKDGLEWRCKISLGPKDKVNDGKWHKIKVPLKDFEDCGAWSNSMNRWFPGEGLFKWNKVCQLVIDFSDNGQNKEVCFKNILIK